MATNVATEPAMYDLQTQMSNVEIVRLFVEGMERGDLEVYDRYLAPRARIWVDSRPSTCPVVFGEDEVFFGPEGMKAMVGQFTSRPWTYEMIIHDVFTSGPVVVVTRTDIRKEDGQADIPVPATGVFALKDGKIIEWSDYFR